MIVNIFKYYSAEYKNRLNISFYEKDSLFFQQPSKFNDPWDCKAPNIIIPRQKEFLKNFFFYIAKSNGIEFARAEWNHLKKEPRAVVRKKFADLFKDALENIRDNVGVFSCSFIPDSELLWSHYTEKHKGYMLHFEIQFEDFFSNPTLSEIGVPIPVIYKQERPRWNLASYYSQSEKHIYDLIRFKSDAWKYEYELRLLNENKFGFLPTPKSWLKSIVLGIFSETTLKDKLTAIGQELNLPVYFAKMDSTKYKITVPGLEIDGVTGVKSYNAIINSNALEIK